VADIPGELTARYYRERFGGDPVGAEELARIEDALRRLDAALPPR
jgi:hypothetical protein